MDAQPRWKGSTLYSFHIECFSSQWRLWMFFKKQNKIKLKKQSTFFLWSSKLIKTNLDLMSHFLDLVCILLSIYCDWWIWISLCQGHIFSTSTTACGVNTEHRHTVILEFTVGMLITETCEAICPSMTLICLLTRASFQSRRPGNRPQFMWLGHR